MTRAFADRRAGQARSLFLRSTFSLSLHHLYLLPTFALKQPELPCQKPCHPVWLALIRIEARQQISDFCGFPREARMEGDRDDKAKGNHKSIFHSPAVKAAKTLQVTDVDERSVPSPVMSQIKLSVKRATSKAQRKTSRIRCHIIDSLAVEHSSKDKSKKIPDNRNAHNDDHS